MFLVINNASENFELLKSSSGVIGLAPTAEGGNYYGNLMPFLRASGLIKHDNFAFRFIDSFEPETL